MARGSLAEAGSSGGIGSGNFTGREGSQAGGGDHHRLPAKPRRGRHSRRRNAARAQTPRATSPAANPPRNKESVRARGERFFSGRRFGQETERHSRERINRRCDQNQGHAKSTASAMPGTAICVAEKAPKNPLCHCRNQGNAQRPGELKMLEDPQAVPDEGMRDGFADLSGRQPSSKAEQDGQHQGADGGQRGAEPGGPLKAPRQHQTARGHSVSRRLHSAAKKTALRNPPRAKLKIRRMTSLSLVRFILERAMIALRAGESKTSSPEPRKPRAFYLISANLGKSSLCPTRSFRSCSSESASSPKLGHLFRPKHSAFRAGSDWPKQRVRRAGFPLKDGPYAANDSPMAFDLCRARWPGSGRGTRRRGGRGSARSAKGHRKSRGP